MDRLHRWWLQPYRSRASCWPVKRLLPLHPKKRRNSNITSPWNTWCDWL